MQNGCHLITYPDSLGGDLEGLNRLLRTRFAEALVGVHILPFYPSSADRGFAPLTYSRVDPAFGSAGRRSKPLSPPGSNLPSTL